MVTDYRGKALVSIALDPAILARMRALRVRRGYKMESMAGDALSRHLDALEALPVKPLTAPARFRNVHKAKQEAGKSVFARMLK